MFYFVYILRCADGTFYCGYTIDLTKRIKAHNSYVSGAKYTRCRRPVKLKYSEVFASKSEALKREFELKKLSHTQKAALFC